MKTIFENSGASYTQVGDYFLPNFALSDVTEKQIGVWGQRHRRYLNQIIECFITIFLHQVNSIITFPMSSVKQRIYSNRQ